MKILLAPDSFKESMRASVVCAAMEKGIKAVFPEAQVISMPMSDGGDGLLDCLTIATQGRIFSTIVQGPLLTPIEAHYGCLGDQSTFVIEIAQACGLELVPKDKRNPFKTSSYGVGQLISAALDHHPKRLIIGLGGSATNDAGLGLLSALGVKFTDTQGNDLKLGGGFLGELESFDLSGLDQRLKDLEIIIACDVTNPLTGPTGASYVYGPQKGADPAMVASLDHQLKHVAQIFKNQLGIDIDRLKGAGAAGGIGSTLMAVLHANFSSGIETVMKLIDFEAALHGVDLILTGEGCIDRQSLYGKTLSGVATAAKRHQIPVIAFAGKVEGDLNLFYEYGLSRIISIVPQVFDLQKALIEGPQNCERAVEIEMHLIKTNQDNQSKLFK